MRRSRRLQQARRLLPRLTGMPAYRQRSEPSIRLNMHHATDFPTRPLAPVRDDRPAARFPPRWRRPCGKAGGPWSSRARASPPSGIATPATRSPDYGRASTRRPWPRRRPSAPIPTWSGAGMNGGASRSCAPGRTRRAPGHRQTGRSCAGAHRDHAERGRSARARGQSESTASAWQPARRAAPIAARPEPRRARERRRRGSRHNGSRYPDSRRRVQRTGAGNRTSAAASSRRAARLRRSRAGQASSGSRKPARRRLARAAQLAAEQCDLLLSIGTSGPGLSAAELPQRALATGAVVAQVNPAATPMDARVKFNLRGQAADVLPRLLQSAGSEPATANAATRVHHPHGARMAISHAHHSAAPAAITTCSRCP